MLKVSLTKGVYPEGLDKPEKLSLRKRTKYFVVQEAQLYYIGDVEEESVFAPFPLHSGAGRSARRTRIVSGLNIAKFVLWPEVILTSLQYGT